MAQRVSALGLERAVPRLALYLNLTSTQVATLATVPWLKVHERGLLVAVERAYRMGKTVLLIVCCRPSSP